MRRLEIDWNRRYSGDFSASLQRYERYLRDIGFRNSTIESYIGQAKRYLEFAKTDRPTIEAASQFRQHLHDKKLSRSTINNYSFSIINYHRMMGENVSLPFLKRNDELPYYFDEDDIHAVFDVAAIRRIFRCCKLHSMPH